VLIDSDGRVLLQQVEGLDEGTMWITPGGGLEPGESHEAAALREIREEVGHDVGALGPWIWTRQHDFTFRGLRYHQRERFFLVRCEPFEVDESGLDELEVEVVKGHRWWTLDEIARSTELFAPRALVELLRPLLRGESPAEPIEVGT
jgi:8-oxo-dGTP pyrophosphatase MutT (NUDIX family)